MSKIQIRREELNRDMQTVFGLIGEEALVELMEYFGGQAVYISRVPLAAAVEAEYDGSVESVRKIARERNVAISSVYRVLNRKTSKRDIERE